MKTKSCVDGRHYAAVHEMTVDVPPTGQPADTINGSLSRTKSVSRTTCLPYLFTTSDVAFVIWICDIIAVTAA